MLKYAASLTLLSATFVAGSAHADERYGCMAQDGKLKLAVHVEYSAELGGRLSHLTGRLDISDPAAPAGLAGRRLTSQMATQHWGDDAVVLVRIFDDSTDKRALDVTLAAAAASSGDSRMHGHYVIRSIPEKGDAYQITGPLFCQHEPATTALLEQIPSEVE